MHARVTTIQVRPERIDEIAAAAKPLLSGAKQQAPSLKTVMLLCDRGSGKLVIVSRWESADAAEAAEPVYQGAMRELASFLTEPPVRERYEVLLDE